MSVLLLLLACASRPAAAPEPAPVSAAPEAPVVEPPPAPAMAFAPLTIPADAGSMKAPLATASVRMDGADHPLRYTVLRRTGDDGFGTLVRGDGTPLDTPCNEQDFDAIVQVDGQAFLTSHFECTPGALTIGKLAQDADGTLSLGEVQAVDWAPLGGLWNPCAGQVSPWNTHLSSEEYEPDGRAAPSPEQKWPHYAWNGMKRYQDEPLNPWRYGWIPEVVIEDASGANHAVKHYAMGRFSHEIAHVLPDERTVYLSDDGYSVGWFLFVADTPRDLSAGRLYAAKLVQEAREGGGRHALEWVDLGHARHDQIAPLVEAKVPFEALFETAEPGDDRTCPEGFRFVEHVYGKECLKLAAPSDAVPDPALAASRLETRRYAAWRGATTELLKGEGVAYDADAGRVYVAISRIEKTMSDGVGHLDLDPVPCGAIYGGDTAAGVLDSDGQPIPSDHVMTRMDPVVAGTSDGKLCQVDGIANPDNIAFVQGRGQLIIAEDTSKHVNAFLWSLDVASGTLQRVMVAPPYGEFTGLSWTPDLGGFGYLTVVVQHPWSEGTDTLPDGIEEADTRTFTGVLGPFPTGAGAE